MLASDKGNMADVRAALGRDLEVGDIVDYSPFNPNCAEIVPAVTPRWHIYETHPNQERVAAAHLIARRFGIFLPEIEETTIRRGRKRDITRLMFTGYIFVFVWGLEKHMHRIDAIPGISRIMLIDGKPAVLGDRIIDEIRAVENKQRPLKAIMSDGTVQTKKKRRWRKWLQQLEDPRNNDIVAVRPWSAFQDSLLTLDGEGRNQTLLKALSLSS